MATIPLQVRQHALADNNAVMQSPLTLDDYLGARFIVEPMRLYDMCMVNDGAVCLLVSRADLARELAQPAIHIAGWGESYVTKSKLETMVLDRLKPQMQMAGDQALAMAGLTLADINHFEAYDVSSMHLLNQVEGFGFTPPGHGLNFCAEGNMTLGGRIPTNTSGGNLSGSYMHGWSQIAEVVRQLRHSAGQRQIKNAEVSLSSLTQTDASHPILFRRGNT